MARVPTETTNKFEIEILTKKDPIGIFDANNQSDDLLKSAAVRTIILYNH